MKKNNIKIYCIALCVSLLGFGSCGDYLDVDKYFDETLTPEAAFAKRIYAEGFLSNAFEVMWEEVCDISCGGSGGYMMFASDELLRMDDNTKKYQNGEYSPDNTLKEDKWKRVYEPVRKASTFIQYIDYCEEISRDERQDMKAQAYFLRGYAYWVLLRQYGPLPLIPSEGFDIGMSYDQLSVQRNTFEECVEQIENDFLLAALNLPYDRTSNNIGRPTKGAALAARARLLLFAASPLYNGNDDMFQLKNIDGVTLIPGGKPVEEKWAKAAAAAYDVIKLAKERGLYRLHTVDTTSTSIAPPLHPEFSTKNFPDGWANIDPFESYRQVFNGAVSAYNNKEIIFTRPNDNKDGLKQLVELMIPASLQGKNSIAVTLKQVNAYDMNDGRTITEAGADYKTSGFTKANEVNGYVEGGAVSLRFLNREPRFYASIAYPGSVWECSSAPLEEHRKKQKFYYFNERDGRNGGSNDLYPVTGVGLKKYYHPEDAVTSGAYIVEKFEPAIRYAEVLLWYAEALNELSDGAVYNIASFDGQTTYEIKRDVEEMRYGIKPIRMRAGMPDFTNDAYDSRDQFRTLLKKERQIELFAESKRYFDLRRWKDAEVEENQPIMGYNVDVQSIGSDRQREPFYEERVVNTYPKIFMNPKMYLWPIPEYEMTRNKRLTQNPGW